MDGLLKKYNILLLGQTGVGKSTFVNSISNYMTYDTFPEALAADNPIIVIDAAFGLTVTEDSGTVHELKINMRGKNRREVEGGLYTDGDSSTTIPSVYSFTCKGIEFNIIDVPGIGDTRGIVQDNLNKQAIIKVIGRFKEIHGICIMVKEGNTRFTNELVFCLNEVLSCLHKNAQDNIFFVLPNSGPSEFQPQTFKPLLKRFIDNLNNVRNTNINIEDRIFCIDNEPFRYQCGYHQSETFRRVFGNQARLEKFETYWNHSKRNVFRCFSKMYAVKGHNTSETGAVGKANTSVQVILSMITNVMACIAEAQTPAYRETQIRQLMGQGTFDRPDVEVSANKPRLVCVHKDCLSVQTTTSGQLKNAKFKQICHEDCLIPGIRINHYPEPMLIHCQMFDLQKKCRICNHDLENHMHMLHEVLQKLTKAGGEGRALTRSQAEKQFDAFVKQVRKEQEAILQSLVIMAVYCRDNAIVAYNTAFHERIEVEIMTAQAYNKSESAAALKVIAKQYKQFAEAYETLGNVNKVVSTKDVEDSIKCLFSLHVYGGSIKSLYDAQLPEAEELTEHDIVRLNVLHLPPE